MNRTSKLERKLRIACDISADRVVAGRSAEDGQSVDVCTVRTLAGGAVTPSLTNTNVINRDAVATAIGDAMAAIGFKQRDLIAIIPDAACRISILDFDDLPAKPQEAESVVRFRLKKSLPFEVDRAQLSYDVRRNNGTVRVIATIALPSIVQEYESAIHQAGFIPGVVLPSTVASLGLVDASRPTLLLKIDSDTTSIAIVNNDDLLLSRTTENPVGEAIDPEQVAEDIYPSLMFFQDTYNLKVERILIGSGLSFDPLAQAIENSTGVRPQELVPQYLMSSAVIGSAQRPFTAGILGALIS